MKGLQGYEISRLAYRIALVLKKKSSPFFAGGRAGKFRIWFYGSANNASSVRLRIKKNYYVIWTTQREELLEEITTKLREFIRRDARLFSKQLGKKSPLLRFKGYIMQHSLQVETSILKNSFAVTQMEF